MAEVVSLELPGWLEEEIPSEPLVGRDSRMRLAIRLAALNRRHGTGAPYGAVVCEQESGRVLAVGVDVVSASGCSVAHAEVLAIAGAQAAAGTPHLRAAGLPDLELHASADPCLMCLGAVLWSGVAALVCGAAEDDWRRTGYDDLPKIDGWERELASRGVTVTRGVLRDEALHVLAGYGHQSS